VSERWARLDAPEDVEDIELEERLRDTLGAERFALELAAGAALTREAAIELALEPSRSEL
jgi:hypothetical protein